jgi:hypothetical protein
MKELKTLILVALLSAACFSCSKSSSGIEEEDPELLVGKGMLAIGVSETGNTKSSDGTSFKLEDLKKAIITIEKDGVVLEDFDSKEVQLENWGDESFTIKGVDLDNGDYSITGFLLKNEDSATTFASPIDGSLAADWVQEALPINFDITVDETTQVDIQVVTTLGSKPADFGYSSLSFSDKTPNVQSYLENIETIFLNKNEKIVHHFTQRGIPTYSEIYRNHKINRNLTLDFIAQTIKHYYLGDGSLPEKVSLENHVKISSQAVVDYFFTEHYASGNIKNIKNNSSKLTLNEKGLVTKDEDLNSAGVVTEYSEYIYNEDDFVIESKYYNADGSFDYSYKFSVDSDGNTLSRSKFDENGDLQYPKYESEYTDGVEVKRTQIVLNENSEEIEYFVFDFEYNSENLRVKDTYTYNRAEPAVYTSEYSYSGNIIISSIETSPSHSYTDFYDEIGMKIDEDIKYILDYKCRLVEKQYEADGYDIVELFNLREELIEKKFYNPDGKLVKTIDNNKVIRFWGNGREKSITSLITQDFDLIGNLTKTDFEYHHPTQKEQFELLNYVIYHDSFDENGVKLSECDVRWFDNNEYSAGVEIHVYENQFEKVDGVLKVTKQVSSVFCYNNGEKNTHYANPDHLYKYVVVTNDLVTGEVTQKYYDAQGVQY